MEQPTSASLQTAVFNVMIYNRPEMGKKQSYWLCGEDSKKRSFSFQ